MHHCGFRDRAGEMRDHPDIVGFGHADDLHVFADAAHIGQRSAHIVDQLLLDQRGNVPFVAKLLAHGDR